MKKTLTGVVALLAGAVVAHSQGTVSFLSYGNNSHGNYVYVTFNGTKIGGAAGTPQSTASADVANGNDWSVALLGNVGSGDAANTLTEGTLNGTTSPAVVTMANGNNDGVAGTWYSSAAVNIPGTTGPGQAATIQLVAWWNDNGTYSSWTSSPDVGYSSTANVTSTGGSAPGSPPVTAPALPIAELGNIPIATPEPSTVALGVMGASAFLLRLRRKK